MSSARPVRIVLYNIFFFCYAIPAFTRHRAMSLGQIADIATFNLLAGDWKNVHSIIQEKCCAAMAFTVMPIYSLHKVR